MRVIAADFPIAFIFHKVAFHFVRLLLPALPSGFSYAPFCSCPVSSDFTSGMVAAMSMAPVTYICKSLGKINEDMEQSGLLFFHWIPSFVDCFHKLNVVTLWRKAVTFVRLTKDMQRVLDWLIDTKPDYYNSFYTFKTVFRESDYKKEDLMRILQQLRECGAITPVIGKPDTFFVTEYGMKYKELQKLSKRQIWIERIWGFATGVVLTLAAWLLSVLSAK